MCGRILMVSLLTGLALYPGWAYATDTSVPFINADLVHAQGITGRGITVAVLDCGVDFAFLDNQDVAAGGHGRVGGHEIPDDGAAAPGETHGTIVSLIITHATGVAPDAKILPIRISAPGSDPDWRDLRDAIRDVIERRHADPSIRVINLSLGAGQYACLCDNENDEMKKLASAVNDAADAGILTVVATGNNAYCGAINAPACLSRVLPVVADYDASHWKDIKYFKPDHSELCTDESPPAYYITCFSNVTDGCAFLVAAPGQDIYLPGFGPEYGTSFAGPHVSGVAALMFEKNACGSLTAATARSLIHSTAWEYNFGYCATEPFPKQVNALAAVNATLGPACPLPGDMNCDGKIGGDDFRLMEQCLHGPGTLPAGICTCAQFPPYKYRDGGDAVDMRDFAQFQLAFTGYGSGACCHPPPYPQCTIESVDVCTAEFGATYQGHGTTCENVECPSPNWGACCYIVELNCSEDAVESCVWQDGMYMGDGSTCAALTCPTGRYHNVIDPPTNYTPCGDGLQLADDITLNGDQPAGLAYYDIAVYGGGMILLDAA